MTRVQFWAVAVAIIVCAAALQLRSVSYGLVWDDLNSLSKDTNALSCLSGPLECLSKPAAARYYRPLFGVSMIGSFTLFGSSLETSAAPMHAENVAWFVLELVLVLLVARRFFGSDDARALFVLGVLAFHPLQNAAVTWVTGRADLLPSVALLASALCLLTQRYTLAVAAFALAVFTKEQTIGAMLMVPALMRGTSWSHRLRVTAAFAAIGVAWLVIARRVLPPEAVNPWLGSGAEHAKVVIRTVAHMSRTLFAPGAMTLHRLTAAPWSTIQAWEVVTAFTTVIIWSGAGVWAFKAKTFAWWLWATAVLVPVTNLIPLNLALSAHRYVLALFPLAMLVAQINLTSSLNWLAGTATVAALALTTFVDQPSFSSNPLLASAVLEADPHNVEWLLAAAGELTSMHRDADALELLDEAVRTSYPGTRSGAERRAFFEQGRGPRQIAEYNSLGRAFRDPGLWLAGPVCMRGQVLGTLGRLTEAIDDLETCVAVWPQAQWSALLDQVRADASRAGQ